MIDWLSSMQQTFEYYTVDPGTWKDKDQLNTVTSCTINRDSTVNTLGSATMDVVEPIGEEYIRIYLIINQNGIRYKLPLGTYIIQTPSSKFDGRVQKVSVDAYTPLIELNEVLPPLGYSILKGGNVLNMSYLLTSENCRAPVSKTIDETNLYYDFVADVNDTWLTFIKDLLSNAKYTYDLDDMGRVLFTPIQPTSSLQPVWTYDDGNSSILYPEITTEHDIYGIPNVVEVIYSNGDDYFYSKVENTDPNSPLSIPNRGRRIIHRDSNPNIVGRATQAQVDKYAELLLEQLSSVEYTITYKHGYCPVRVGDCVRLNYERAGLMDIKAKVIKQDIECVPGTPVTETAIFNTKLWR